MDNIKQWILMKVLIIPAILIAFTFHEYAHALVADKLGDKTPKFQGRLTLNPFVHIDIFGFIMILLVNFGWAKPIEINPNSFKHYYKDDLKVSFAGPFANLAVSFISAMILGLVIKFSASTLIMVIVCRIIYYIISINCILFFFNLLPIPGLDGFNILKDLFPKFFYTVADKLYAYQFIILIIFIMPIGNFSLAGLIIDAPSNMLIQLFMSIGRML